MRNNSPRIDICRNRQTIFQFGQVLSARISPEVLVAWHVVTVQLQFFLPEANSVILHLRWRPHEEVRAALLSPCLGRPEL